MPDRGLGDCHGLDRAAETDLTVHVGTVKFPRNSQSQPVLGVFLLPAVLHHLAEQPVLIADAVAVGGHVEGCHAFHEAGGEASEAAIAEGGVGFGDAQPVEIDVEAGEGCPHRVHLVEVVQVVEQQTADEEFQGKVIDPLGAVLVGGVDAGEPAIDDLVAQRVGGCHHPVTVGGDGSPFADAIGQLFQDRGLQRRDVFVAGRRLEAGRVGVEAV